VGRDSAISACPPAPRRVHQRSASIYSKQSESRNRLPTRADGSARSECSLQPKQHWDFHQRESRLTTLRVLRYCSGQKKRWFKFPIQITNYANIVPSHYNVDLAVSYDMGDQPENEYLRNISLQLVVNNVTNKKLKAEF